MLRGKIFTGFTFDGGLSGADMESVAQNHQVVVSETEDQCKIQATHLCQSHL